MVPAATQGPIGRGERGRGGGRRGWEGGRVCKPVSREAESENGSLVVQGM